MPDSPPIRLKIAVDDSAARTGIDALNSYLKKLDGGGIGAAANRVVSNASFGVTSTFGNIQKSVSGASSALVTFSAGLFALDRIGGFLKSGLIDPFANISKSILDATETYRRFELVISSSRGAAGLATGKAFDDKLISRTSGSGLTIASVQSAAKQESIRAGSDFGLRTDEGAIQQSIESARLLKRLSLISGMDEAAAAQTLRLVIDGGGADKFNLRKLGITGNELGGGHGDKSAEADPNAMKAAISSWATKIIPDSALNELNNLVGARVDRLHDTFNRVLRDVGEAGAYDKVAGVLNGVEKSIGAYLKSPVWATQSAALGDNISGVLDSVGKSVLGFSRGLLGMPSNADIPEAVIETVTEIIKRVGDVAKDLPDSATKFGQSLHGMSSAVTGFADKLGYIAEKIGGFIPIAGDFDKSTGKYNATESGIDQRENAIGLNAKRFGIGIQLQDDPKSFFQDLMRGEWAGNPHFKNDWSGVKDEDRPRAAAYTNAIQSAGDFDISTQARLDRYLAGKGFNPSTNNSGSATAPRSPYGQLTDQNADLFRQTDRGYDMTSRTKGMGDVLNEMSGKDAKDPYSTAQSLLKSKLKQLDGDFKTAGETITSEVGRYDLAIDQFSALLKAGALSPSDLAGTTANIESLTTGRSRLQAAWKTALDNIRQQIPEAYGRAEMGLLAALSKDAAITRAAMMDKIISGDTAEAQKAMSMTGLSVDHFQFSAIPLKDRTTAFNDVLKAHEDAGKSNGLYGGPITTGSSYSDIMRQTQHPLSDQVTAKNELNDLQKLQPLAEANLDAAKAGGDPRQILQAADAVAQLGSKLRQLSIDSSVALKGFIQFGDQAQSTIENGLGKSLSDLETKGGHVKEIFASMARSILDSFNQMAAHNLMSSVFGTGGDGGKSGMGSIFGNLFGGNNGQRSGNASNTGPHQQEEGGGPPDASGSGLGGAALGIFGSILGAFIPGAGSLVGSFAGKNGNGDTHWSQRDSTSSDFGGQSIAGYAEGGIVGRSTSSAGTLIRAGETSAEGVVPLSGGRSIPVEMLNSSQNQKMGDLYVVSNHEEAFKHGLDSQRDAVLDVFASSVRRGGSVLHALRSKGH